MTNQVIILGDPHIGKALSFGKGGAGNMLNSRLIDQFALLDWVLEEAITNNIFNIIITGDVFEEPKPKTEIITLFMSWLKKCSQSGVQVDILIGNHDILRTGFFYSSPLDIIEEAEIEHIHIHKNITTIFIGSTGFTLVPFRDRKSFGSTFSNSEALSLLQESLTYEIASIPDVYHKVLVGHLALEKSIPVGDEIDDIANELFCPYQMFDSYQYVWMGHIHKPQIMQYQPCHIAHIGSMDISNFGETAQDKIIVIFDTDRGSFQTKILPTRGLKKINLSIPKDVLDTTQFVHDQLSSYTDLNKSIVKLEIVLEDNSLLSVEKDKIEQYFIQQGVFSVAGISESRITTLIKKDKTTSSLHSKMDFASAARTYASACIDPEHIDLFLQTMQDIFKEFQENN